VEGVGIWVGPVVGFHGLRGWAKQGAEGFALEVYRA
jgi:hypothetical protein